MKPSLIVYKVPGGKTRFAQRIAQFYGLIWRDESMTIRLTEEVDFFEGGYEEVKGWEEYGFNVKSFEEVAKEINAVIPLTAWASTNAPPEHIGEYEYQYPKGYEFRAYWDGKIWTIHDQEEKYFWGEPVSENGKWRGLSQEPINTKE